MTKIKNFFKKRLFSLILTTFLISGVINMLGCYNLMTRDVVSSDYSYTTSQDLTGYLVTIVPKTDMNNCDVELKLYNYGGELVFTDTISKTNLKKDNSYTYHFEFGIVNSLFGSSVRIAVTGKCPLINLDF